MLDKILIFLIFFGAGLAAIIAVGQMIERPRNAGNYILSLLLLCIAVWQSYHGFMVSGILAEYPHLAFLHAPFLYFTGPLLYFYFRFLTDDSYRYRLINILHFIPGLLITLLLSPFYTLDAQTKRELLVNPIRLSRDGPVVTVYAIIILLIVVSMIIYMAIFLKDSASLMRARLIRIGRITFLSLAIMALTFLAIFTYFAGFLLYNVYDFSHGFYEIVIKTISLMMCAFVLLVYYMGRRYPRYTLQAREGARKIRYENSRIQGLDVDAVMDRLLHAMNTDKIYTREDLSLALLAGELSIAPYQLSQILNERLNKNFNAFVNEYRIREAQGLLTTDPERSVTSVTYAVGFNSPSSFYEWFIKLTGLTPVKYRENQGRRKSRS
ncbi:MAG: AraC family transcriptional regulator [Spirochaetes bacterium]|nr:MAG: AraC family transcriptional regulator [Spirochaetota bacterium]